MHRDKQPNYTEFKVSESSILAHIAHRLNLIRVWFKITATWSWWFRKHGDRERPAAEILEQTYLSGYCGDPKTGEMGGSLRMSHALCNMIMIVEGVTMIGV